MRSLFAAFWRDLIRSRHYVAASLIAFAAGCAAGWTGYAGMDRFAEQSAAGLRQLAEWIGSSEHPWLALFLFIFFNNAIKAVLFVFLGAFLGLFPMIVLVANGSMLGYLLQSGAGAAGAEMGALELFARGILPHGIVELPALFAACAYGIRFGFLLVRSLFLAATPEGRGRAGAELAHFFRMLVPLLILVTVAMFVAAVIESTVTPALVG